MAYLPFEGEQHGFRRAENIKNALGGELYFYSRVFGFDPAGLRRADTPSTTYKPRALRLR